MKARSWWQIHMPVFENGDGFCQIPAEHLAVAVSPEDAFQFSGDGGTLLLPVFVWFPAEQDFLLTEVFQPAVVLSVQQTHILFADFPGKAAVQYGGLFPQDPFRFPLEPGRVRIFLPFPDGIQGNCGHVADNGLRVQGQASEGSFQHQQGIFIPEEFSHVAAACAFSGGFAAAPAADPGTVFAVAEPSDKAAARTRGQYLTSLEQHSLR